MMRTLDAHPEILCRGEGRFFGGWRRPNLDLIRHSGHLASSLEYALSSSEYLKLWLERSPWTRAGVVEEHLTDLAGMTVRHFLFAELARSGKKVVGDKTPLLSPNDVEEIHRICPDAKVIHIARDGRNTAVSMIHHLWNRSTDRGGIQTLEPDELRKREAFRSDRRQFRQRGESIFTEERLRTVAETWNLRVGKTIEDGPALFGGNYVEVRYEQLLERPQEEVTRLARFLGADTSEETVRRAVSSTSFEKLAQGRSRGDEDPGAFYRKGISGDWKNYFTERDKEIYKKTAGDLLVELGYENDYAW